MTRDMTLDTLISRIVILSAAKDLRRKPVAAPIAVHRHASPISIFQFPFSIQPGGTVKP
jgi:hypothetical protein